MFKRFFRQSRSQRDAHALYGMVVARARNEAFFGAFQIPDTFDGRFEMLVMHLFLVHARLRDEDRNARAVSQLIFDAFLDDMDAALREAGVGDQTVPKRINKMTRVFYGRTGAFEKALALDSPIQALEDIIARNLYPDEEPDGRERPLARYFLGQWQQLRAASVETILAAHHLFEHDFERYLSPASSFANRNGDQP